MITRTKWTLIAATTFLFVACGCDSSLVAFAAGSSRDWQFVQTVGGIALGTPQRDGRGHILLPIRCDVSGTQTITVRPTAMNSALVCEPPIIRVRSSTVLLTVRTSVPSKRYPSASCPDADLGPLTAGAYSVVYASPDGSQHPLGSIQIP